MAATFIVVGIVVVPMILLVADILVGKNRLTEPAAPVARRRSR